MDLEKVFTVQGILLILTGVFLLVMGIKVVIRQTKIRKQDLIKEGTVLHSRHVEQSTMIRDTGWKRRCTAWKNIWKGIRSGL